MSVTISSTATLDKWPYTYSYYGGLASYGNTCYTVIPFSGDAMTTHTIPLVGIPGATISITIHPSEPAVVSKAVTEALPSPFTSNMLAEWTVADIDERVRVLTEWRTAKSQAVQSPPISTEAEVEAETKVELREPLSSPSPRATPGPLMGCGPPPDDELVPSEPALVESVASSAVPNPVVTV